MTRESIQFFAAIVVAMLMAMLAVACWMSYQRMVRAETALKSIVATIAMHDRQAPIAWEVGE